MQSSSAKPAAKPAVKPKGPNVPPNGLSATHGHSDADRELKAYIYQQLVDIQPFLVPDSQMAVTVQHVLPSVNSDSSDGPRESGRANTAQAIEQQDHSKKSSKDSAKKSDRRLKAKRGSKKIKATFLETSVADTTAVSTSEPSVASEEATAAWLNGDSADETSSAALLAEAAEAGIIEIPAGGVYVVKLVATMEGGKLEVEGHGQNVYQAFGEAKGNMVNQLNEIHNALMDPSEREEEIQSFLRGERTLH